MNPLDEYRLDLTRRQLLLSGSKAVGAAALATLLGHPAARAGESTAAAEGKNAAAFGGLADLPHLAPKAKRVIYLFMAGGPSHIDMFDYKPAIEKIHGTELPASIRGEQRITGMTSGQKSFPCVAPMVKFKQHGERGTWISEILPHTAGVADELTIVRSMHTEAINHDPAITYINTGTQQLGKPSMGAWLSYGLGSLNENLPAYVVMISHGKGNAQALYARLWGSGFLPSQHQGVQFRSDADPVLYLSNPPGIDAASRRRMLDALAKMNEEKFAEFGDPEIRTRIAQYEMAFRMQTSVPDLVDVADEPASTFELYGDDAKKPGTFARNALLARRMAERGVRFTQLFHEGWDQHNNLPKNIAGQAKDVDQATAALVTDLKQRGMLDDTLVIFGGEFGRTIYSQGALTKDNHGRDHHGRCFTTWLAGAGIKRGFDYGETDDYCYNVVRDGVHIRDLNATILNQVGVDHTRLIFKYQGLDQRLTGVEPARVVKEILS